MIAGIVMLAILLSMAAVPFTRWETEFPYKLDATRYIFMYKFAAATFVWACADVIGNFVRNSSTPEGNKSYRIFLTSLSVIFLTCITVLQYKSHQALVRGERTLMKVQGANELAVYMLGVDPINHYSLKTWFSGGNTPEVYTPVISWLASKQKNVFSADYRASIQLANYKEARAIYLASHTTPLPLEINEVNCFQHPKFRDRQAWNVDIKFVTNGNFSLFALDGANEGVQYPLRVGRQSFYGMFPAGTRLRMCFPQSALVKSMTHLPARTEAE